MSMLTFYRSALQVLQNSGIESAAFELDVMIEAVSGCHRLQTEQLSQKQKDTLEHMIARRCQREPLQYILGNWDFLSLRLYVGPGVLVPRPETEELCLLAANFLQQCPVQTALDLCSGSGALALGLQSLCPKASIIAVELYDEAFSYLSQNCAHFKAQYAQAPTPILADVCTYHNQLTQAQFSLLVANPPYLTSAEYDHLEAELYFEPKQALFAKDNGLFFYKIIAKNYYKALISGGAVFFEIGAKQAADVQAIMNENGYQNVRIHQDLSGKARICEAHKA